MDAVGAHEPGLVTDGGRTFHIREGVLDDADDPSLPWNPIDEETRRALAHIRSAGHLTLEQIGKVRVGVKTTADEVFIRADWGELGDDLRPEEELIRPLMTHRDVTPWRCRPGERRILYPHEDQAGRATAVALEDYPRAAAYLSQHRDRLVARSYVIDAGRKWYEIWVPQSPAIWSRRKVVFPDIAEAPRFAVDESGAVVNGDCYWMVADDPDVAEVIVAVGNSSFCTWFYDAACGNLIYAGRRRRARGDADQLATPPGAPRISSHPPSPVTSPLGGRPSPGRPRTRSIGTRCGP